MKLLNKTAALTFTLTTFGIIGGIVSSHPVFASSTIGWAKTIQYTPPPAEPGNRPGGRGTSGSRGNCQIPENQPSLTALAPATQVSAAITAQSPGDASLGSYESVWSLTTEAHPSFWFYMPYTPNENIPLEFVLQDESGNTLYESKFVAREHSSGIIQIFLPETLPPLTIDQAYQWYFLTHCDPDSADVPPYVSGWIIRTKIDANLQAQINAASPLDQASLYATHGFWQDSLTILGELYREESQNAALANNWHSLLTSVGLTEIVEEPLIECCSFTQIEQVTVE